MRLAIVGSRSIEDPDVLVEGLRRIRKQFPGVEIDEIVTGGAAGADWLGEDYARRVGIKLTVFHPDWNRYGKRAAFLRNRDIVQNADVVLALWDGESKGTKMTLDLAERHYKPTVIVYPDDVKA